MQHFLAIIPEMTDKVETVSARTTGYVGSEELSRNLTKREIVPNELAGRGKRAHELESDWQHLAQAR